MKKQTTTIPLFAFGMLTGTALRILNRWCIILLSHLSLRILNRWCVILLSHLLCKVKDNRNVPNTLRNPYPSETDLSRAALASRENMKLLYVHSRYLSMRYERSTFTEKVCLASTDALWLSRFSLNRRSQKIFIHDQPPYNTLQVIRRKKASLTGPPISAS